MKIYDISQEIFSSKVFPGDPVPGKENILSVRNGDPCNLTRLHLGSHSGSHMDAPSHFYQDGRTIDQVNLNKCIGPCKVVSLHGLISAEDIRAVLSDNTCRLLIKGNIVISTEAAREMNGHRLQLVGVEGLTVGPVDAPKDVHLELLGNETVILEGLVLSDVPDGFYFLAAQPLKLGGVDGSPCRPVLIEY